MVEAQVADLEDALKMLDPADVDLTDAMDCRSILITTAMGLGQVKERLEDLIGDAMGSYRVVVGGHGQIERHKKKSRRNWQSDDLLRMVLDTRRVNSDTGEIESDVDKIKHVYPLAGYNARVGALKERGIDPDEWCETETRPGWKLRTF